MIIGFRHKGLQLFFETGSTRGIRAQHAKRLTRILTALNIAQNADYLDNLVGLRLHALKGELNGYFSAWVNGNWRVIFRFEGNDVELVDYPDHH